MGTINEIEVSYRHEIPASLWKKIGSSADAAAVLYEHWDKGTIGLQESFKVVLLNNGNRVKGIYEISKGGITGTMVQWHPKAKCQRQEHYQKDTERLQAF